MLAKRAASGHAAPDEGAAIQPDALARLRIPPSRLPALTDSVRERLEHTVASFG